MDVFRTGVCTRGMDSTKCRQRQAGRRRMSCGEEHRKAVCGRTARTVWGGRAGDWNYGLAI